MAEARETRVAYKAIAEFATLHRELRKTRRELAKTQAAEKAFNASSAKSYKETAKAFQDSVKVQQKAAKAQDTAASSTVRKTNALRKEAIQLDKTRKSTVKFVESVESVNLSTGEVVETTKKVTETTNKWSGALDRARQFMSRYTSEAKNGAALEMSVARAKERHLDATERLRISELRLSELRRNSSSTASRIAAAELRVAKAKRSVRDSTINVQNAVKRLNREGNDLNTTFRKVDQGGTRLFNSLQKFGNWRPRLVPPFVALIPIIGAVIAAINPLIALLGSVGSVAIGLAGSIGSLSGAFLALPGILSAVVSGISSVIASMGGVGNVFKTYSAMQKATNSAKGGTGSSGPTQAERADALADAEWNLSKAQRSVQKAQENLNKARQKALKDLIDLRLEVSRASMTEERAVANLRKAQEDYWNVLADPGSTKGDKLDAAVSIKEAEADLQDVRKKNIENQKELTAAEKKGINGSEQVIDAQERLTDALISQRDAQKALTKEQNGGAGATSTAAVQSINEFNNALAELSPSARKFVLAILAMEAQWKSFKREMQEEFFSQFVNDLGRLPRLLTTLTTFLRPSAKAMGEFVSSFLQMLDTPEWSNDLAAIGKQNATIISALGDAFLSLATAMKDIIIAAGPFTEWMVTGFAKGADNFEKFVGNARKTGQLARWLEKVSERMQKWWTVVKNVGATIFNYSAAAEDFGGWLLDGFVNLSEGWRKASEEARKEGSPFQEYLEDIRPLLSEVKGLFGDFFGWLRREMMDPANIKDSQDLVKVIRDDLGPALGGLLDTLSKTKIDQKFVKALSSILASLDKVLDNGGGAAFEAFFDVVVAGFEALADVVQVLSDAGLLEPIIKFFGVIAGLTFVGKFTGITNLLAGIMGFNGKTSLFTKLGNLFGWFKDLDKLKFTKLLGKAGLFAGIAGMGLGIAGSFDEKGVEGTDPGLTAAGGAVAGASIGGVPGALIGGVAGLIASALIDILDEKDGSWNKGWDQLFKPGDYSGAGIGEIKKWFDDTDREMDRFWSDLGGKFKNGWNQIVTFFTVSVPGFFEGLGAAFENGWTQITDWYYNNFGSKFENGWNQIVTFFTVSVPGFFTGLKTSFQNGWTQITDWYYENFGSKFENGWNQIVTFFTVSVPGFFESLGTSFQNGWTQLTTWFDTTFVQPVKDAWKTVQDAFAYGWKWIETYVILPFRLGWQRLATWFDTTFVQPIKKAWTTFQTTLSSGWNWINSNVLSPFKSGFNTLKSTVSSIVNGLGTKWNELRNKFKDPVKFVVDTVYNKGILGVWNGIAKKFGWNQLSAVKMATGGVLKTPVRKYATGGVLPGYTPGRDVHDFVSPTGGRLSLSGGEAIMRPEFTKMVGGEKGVEEINKKAIRGQKFASGGVFNGGGSTQKFAKGGVWEVAGDVWDSLTGFFSDPLKYIKDGISKLVPSTSRIQGNDYGRMISKIPESIIKNLGSFAQGKTKLARRENRGDSIKADGKGMKWQSMWASVKKAFPSASLNSAYRPGAITSLGSKSYHGMGRAIDVTPSAAIFNWIKKNYPNSSELIYSPMGGQQLQNGRNRFWGEPVRSQHWDHVHWAMKNGGVIPGLYDNGGWLPHGGMAVNKSGKPEAVLDPQESRALKALLSGTGLGARPAFSGATSATGLQSMAPQSVNNSINIDKVEIVNPVPEKVSDSLPKSIRRIGYMNEARTNS